MRLSLASAKGKMLAARKLTTHPVHRPNDVCQLECDVRFGLSGVRRARLAETSGLSCQEFALKTLERMLREAWSEEARIRARVGGPALRGSLDDQVFGVMALLDAYEATLDSRVFSSCAPHHGSSPSRNMATPDGGGFFDRASDAPAMGGLEVRRKPFQDSPTPSANSVAAMALTRMHCLHRQSEILRMGQEHARGLCRRSPAVWPFRRDLRAWRRRFSPRIRRKSSSPAWRAILPP